MSFVAMISLLSAMFLFLFGKYLINKMDVKNVVVQAFLLSVLFLMISFIYIFVIAITF